MAPGAALYGQLLPRAGDWDSTAAAATAPDSLPQLGIPGQPFAGSMASLVLSLVSATVLSVLLTLRAGAVRSWRLVPPVAWLLLAVYAGSYASVASSVLVQFGVNANAGAAQCDAAVLACLTFYVSSKTLLYLFLAERAHVVRGGGGRGRPRARSRLYLFNVCGVGGAFVVIVAFNFVHRIRRIDGGTCYIGLEREAMIPLISFDVAANVYLTILFLIPLTGLYSFRNAAGPPTRRLRAMAAKTFVGSCCILTTAVINLSVLMTLNGEPSWVCFTSCNSELLFSALVLFWITSKDNAATAVTSRSYVRRGGTHRRAAAPSLPPSSPPRRARRHSEDDAAAAGAEIPTPTAASAVDTNVSPPPPPPPGDDVATAAVAAAVIVLISPPAPAVVRLSPAEDEEELRDMEAALRGASTSDSSSSDGGSSVFDHHDEKPDDYDDDDGEGGVHGEGSGSSNSSDEKPGSVRHVEGNGKPPGRGDGG
ncbi:hypothetical protein RB595_004741 [Gaeumannomyces hyphopodioides]